MISSLWFWHKGENINNIMTYFSELIATLIPFLKRFDINITDKMYNILTSASLWEYFYLGNWNPAS